ncbi:MAG: hypothetical protein EOO38_17590, partial [Cytophagaceae bacterium]
MFYSAKQRSVRLMMTAAMVGCFISTAPAHAATQGSIGATSTGTVTINATINALVQISDLNDLTFSGLTGSATAQQTDNVCVWSNTSSKSYTIKATGNGTTNAFTLANGTNAAIPYSVAWANTASATSGTALTTNVASAAFTSTATLPLCNLGASPTSTLLVSIGAADQAA